MSRFNKSLVTVFEENGRHKVMLPSEEVLPHLVKTIVEDGVHFSTVEISCLCNIVSTKSDAISKYQSSKSNEDETH